MGKTTEYLFSYGTLQKDNVQLELFGRLLKGKKAGLKGYRLSYIEIRDEAFLSKGEQSKQLIAIPSNDQNDVIEGSVFEMTEEELTRADQYEPHEYKRVRAALVSGEKTWVYAAVL